MKTACGRLEKERQQDMWWEVKWHPMEKLPSTASPNPRLDPGLVGLQVHCSHPRARTPQHRGRWGHPSPCVTEPMVDSHCQAGNDSPSVCGCYVCDRRFCRGCRTRRGVIKVGLDHFVGGALVRYCQYAWLWYLRCYVTH